MGNHVESTKGAVTLNTIPSSETDSKSNKVKNLGHEWKKAGWILLGLGSISIIFGTIAITAFISDRAAQTLHLSALKGTVALAAFSGTTLTLGVLGTAAGTIIINLPKKKQKEEELQMESILESDI